MRRLNGIERGVLALAGLLVVGGIYSLARPREALFIHPATDDSVLSHPITYWQPVTKQSARIYGAVALLTGCGLAAGTIWKPGGRRR